MAKDLTRREQKLWNPFETDQKLKRRRFFVIKLLNGALRGLAYMHDHDRLHQSLGPASVILKYITTLNHLQKFIHGLSECKNNYI